MHDAEKVKTVKYLENNLEVKCFKLSFYAI